MKIVSASPHLHSGSSTQRIMLDVIIAMLPALGFSFWAYGLPAVVVTLTAVASCVAFEWFITRFLLRKANTVTDLSAVVTGILLAFNLPAEVSPWLVVLGSLVAVGVGKMSFGGLGRNPFNPALVGRVFLLLSFPVQLTTYTFDGVTGATPLTMFKEQGAAALPDVMDMLLGVHGGSLGEMSALLLIIGGVYLLIRKVITWHIPVFVLGSMALFAEILWLTTPETAANVTFHLFAGGAMLGAFYMATDYSSSPMSKRAQVVYAVGIGVITMLIRVWGAYPEGMSFAILIMNATVPLLNMYLKPKPFGKSKK